VDALEAHNVLSFSYATAKSQEAACAHLQCGYVNASRAIVIDEPAAQTFNEQAKSHKTARAHPQCSYVDASRAIVDGQAGPADLHVLEEG